MRNSIMAQLVQQLAHLDRLKLVRRDRAFKVKFAGEGADDYGGPYREVLITLALPLRLRLRRATLTLALPLPLTVPRGVHTMLPLPLRLPLRHASSALTLTLPLPLAVPRGVHHAMLGARGRGAPARAPAARAEPELLSLTPPSPLPSPLSPLTPSLALPGAPTAHAHAQRPARARREPRPPYHAAREHERRAAPVVRDGGRLHGDGAPPEGDRHLALALLCLLEAARAAARGRRRPRGLRRCGAILAARDRARRSRLYLPYIFLHLPCISLPLLEQVCSSLHKIEHIEDEGVDEELFADLIFDSFTTALSNGTEVEVVEGGAHIDVTWHNRAAYCAAVRKARLREGSTQTHAVLRGLNSLLPVRLLAL